MVSNKLLGTQIFLSASEATRKSLALDSAHTEQIFRTDSNEITNFRAVVNERTNQVVCVPSQNYKVILHSQIANTISEYFGSLNVPIFGKIDDYGDQFSLTVIFKDSHISIDPKGKINLGIRFTNSYDLSRAFKGEFFGFRQYCMNGLAFGKTTHLVFKHKHTGNFEVDKVLIEFIHKCIKENTSLNNYISNCLKDSIEWELAEKIINRFFPTNEKVQRIILENAKDESSDKQLTRWELYNGITYWATHFAGTLTAHDSAQIKAEKLLTTPSEKLKILISTN